jgi:hypothetical protein
VNGWDDLGARHRKSPKRLGGHGTWTLTLEPGRIEATHAPYLASSYGDDAWRISVQVPGDPMWTEVRHDVCASEQDAVTTVARLADDPSTWHRRSWF